MQRVSGANFLPNGNGAGKNAYQDYNAAVGQAGTTPNAAALNALQEEISGFIEAKGIALNAADNTQLMQAIAATIGAALAGFSTGAFPSSMGSTGYQQLPNGLILQWGGVVISAGASTYQTVALPITFPNAAFEAFGSSGSTSSYAGARTNGPSSIQVFASNNTATVLWWALGN